MMTGQQTATVEAIVNIFETGRMQGSYGRIAVLKGDSGHLSYGRSQASLGSGSLFELLSDYCSQPATTTGADLIPFLPRFRQKDASLDTDATVRALLKKAGDDPVMRATQDRFFATKFLTPALDAAERLGITQPLGKAVVYDSHIQGGWSRLQPRIGSVSGLGEQRWIQSYIDVRRQWLLSLDAPLPATVYRMNTFTELIAEGKWFLELPLVVRGVTITAQDLDEPPPPASAARLLRLTSPFMRGDDVKAVQAKLGIPQDGIYGPFTESKVAAFKQREQIVEAGVGPATLAKLGL